LDVNHEARLVYVRRHYSRHPEDAMHHHLIVDSTAIDLEDVVDVVVRASEARCRQAGVRQNVDVRDLSGAHEPAP
jgi:hypothetical protein